jgi:hypothetical protein
MNRVIVNQQKIAYDSHLIVPRRYCAGEGTRILFNSAYVSRRVRRGENGIFDTEEEMRSSLT